jgi:hypothetical protein
MAQDRSPHDLQVSQQQAMMETSHAGYQPTNHSPHAVQQPAIHGSRAEQQPALQSLRGQRVRAYYEIDTSRVVDKSPSSENDQWARGEVKENMPLGGATDNAVIGIFLFFKNFLCQLNSVQSLLRFKEFMQRNFPPKSSPLHCRDNLRWPYNVFGRISVTVFLLDLFNCV